MENIILMYQKNKHRTYVKKKQTVERQQESIIRKQNEIVNGRSMTTETFLNNSKQKNNKRAQVQKDQKQ